VFGIFLTTTYLSLQRQGHVLCIVLEYGRQITSRVFFFLIPIHIKQRELNTQKQKVLEECFRVYSLQRVGNIIFIT
jgi:hypothetical protein